LYISTAPADLIKGPSQAADSGEKINEGEPRRRNSSVRAGACLQPFDNDGSWFHFAGFPAENFSL